MIITKLPYEKIICFTKKDSDILMHIDKYPLLLSYADYLVYIQKHDYRDELSSHFLKINDNETPRSYHDPKVPAHDVWRFFQVLLLMLMCWSHLKSRIPFSLIFTTYKAYILIYIMPYTKTKCVIQYIYVLFSQMFTVNNKVVYPGASLCAQ